MADRLSQIRPISKVDSGVDDVHFHPVEPLPLREFVAALTYMCSIILPEVACQSALATACLVFLL